MRQCDGRICEQERVGAVLVAAGLSSRMGDFKPLLPFGGTSIARHIVAALKRAGAGPVVVVTGYRGEELERHLAAPGVRFVRNAHFRETQMFDSVKLGLAEAAPLCGRIAIMPMDVPGIRQRTLERAMAAAGPIVRTMYRGEPGHPIVIDSRLAARLCAYAGERGLRGALEESGIPICELQVEDDGVLKDVDTKEEYRRLLASCNQEGL